MKWDDIDDCEGCGKKRSAVARLAAKVDRIAGSAVMRLARVYGTDEQLVRLATLRVYIAPHKRVVKGKTQNVDGYWKEIDVNPDGTPKGSLSSEEKTAFQKASADRPKGAGGGAPTPPRPSRINTPTQGKGYTPPGAARSEVKGATSASSPTNIPNIPEVALKVDSGSGTKDDPFVTKDIDTAAALIMHRKDEKGGEVSYHVRLQQERQVSTLLDRVKALVDDAVEKGKDAPVYDLCKVTVPGTNLFCIETKGIARVNMPQLTSDHPAPGSDADKMERDDQGEVNLSELFQEYITGEAGFEVTEEDVDPSYLRATQNELNGFKVAKLAGKIAKGGYNRDKPIFVTADDYIVDGHHRWAGAIGAEYKTGADLSIPVRRINASITEILPLAVKWTADMGIPTEAASQTSKKV